MNLPEISVEYWFFFYGIGAGILITTILTLVVAIVWKLFNKPARKDKEDVVKAETPPQITDMPILEARAKETEEKQRKKVEQAHSAQKQIREIMGDKPVVVVSRRVRGGNTHGEKG